MPPKPAHTVFRPQPHPPLETLDREALGKEPPDKEPLDKMLDREAADKEAADRALIDLKDTADQCLIIFWRIEATITGNKDSASDEELARKLVQFNKLLIKDEAAKVSLDDTIGDPSWSVFGSIRWTYIDFKLDGYSQQFHHYQGCLTLMCSVVSLGELRTIGTQ
ncbi:hypothetical protein INS49_004230 [Diaporthe citri]|uniref:uncharacterized protein n=1 Tax=Diaporthe citri TaxID=83186 RepID=UPI001C82695D|nr:uncharacterized protein INS49_004230 [Diaporthe citri]KAG6355149.1 hypothetical protein INS49_004230 [Diaporthe citri]